MPEISSTPIEKRDTIDTQSLISRLSQVFANPDHLPLDWDPAATTYDLPRHYSEAEFMQNLTAALQTIHDQQISDPAQIRSLLSDCGHPYDYARLGQPYSTIYEYLIQAQTGAKQVVSFASATKPFLAVIEARSHRKQVISIVADGRLPLSTAKKKQLQRQAVQLQEQIHLEDFIAQNASAELTPDTIRIFVCSEGLDTCTRALQQGSFDAVCFQVQGGGVLLIADTDKIKPEAIQVIRKRTTAALLAFDSQREIQQLLKLEFDGDDLAPLHTLESACNQALSSIFPAISADYILYFCTGLAAEAAVFTATAKCLQAVTTQTDPIPLFYAQNGYGGTGQLIGEVLTRERTIAPYPLTVLGLDEAGNPQTLVEHFLAELTNLAGPALLFLETPTNPELQMHDFKQLRAGLEAYQAETEIQIPVIVDTTMAPLYPLFSEAFAQDWPFLIVKSGSKYFTKGKATLGVAFCGHHPLAQAIIETARDIGSDADSFAKASQLTLLYAGLQDLAPRMASIAANTAMIAAHLQFEMQQRERELTCYTMNGDQIEAGLATGILSFYLPPAPTADGRDLVDEFVDFMLAALPDQVRNRVSYGQSSGGDLDLVYIINPQESTQGSLSDAVKEAQKKDNVQICRISVPEKMDVESFNQALSDFFELKYGAIKASLT